MVGVKGHSSHAEEESSALLPAKDRQMKATWVTCQLHKEIERCAIRMDVTRQT